MSQDFQVGDRLVVEQYDNTDREYGTNTTMREKDVIIVDEIKQIKPWSSTNGVYTKIKCKGGYSWDPRDLRKKGSAVQVSGTIRAI